jgi:TPR repeat protein
MADFNPDEVHECFDESHTARKVTEDLSFTKRPDLTSPAVGNAEINLGGGLRRCSTVRVMKAPKRLLTILLLSASATFGGEIDDILVKAKAGDMVAQIQAAEMYSSGKGVAKDSKEALAWYQKAAEQGSADAQLSLGKLYVSGQGVPKNSVEAAKWFLLAAQQGRAVAQIQMARMHLAGAGVMKDYVEAYKWAKLAGAQGDGQAQQILSFLVPKMTPQQTARAETLVRESLEKKTSDDASKGVPLVAPPLE